MTLLRIEGAACHFAIGMNDGSRNRPIGRDAIRGHDGTNDSGEMENFRVQWEVVRLHATNRPPDWWFEIDKRSRRCWSFRDIATKAS